MSSVLKLCFGFLLHKNEIHLSLGHFVILMRLLFFGKTFQHPRRGIACGCDDDKTEA
jgi:hypothetical protein